MAIQKYDTIGASYNDVPQLATGKLQLAAIQALIGDIKGLTVLELACGPGFYCRKAISWGARHATGVDISPTMIHAARANAKGDKRMEFHIADCIRPFNSNIGQFDLILAPWLLNYARNESELVGMWRNAYNSLKPGGKVIGITTNLHLLDEPTAFPTGRRFGQELEVLGSIEDGGLEVRATLFTSKPFSFTNYYLPSMLYEKSALLAGLSDFRWISITEGLLGDCEVDWDAFSKCPPFLTFTAVRPLDVLK
ncbi:methyltransferase [Aspergillus flavus]|uniref:Methyltransferase n=1 Tax=Aspergillus flavus (strain ATCC 200026 / FGSC A1120 / IAM 13836 / NRRL 3357 / JCM 12722 / SRRC 167) TaxID=332952 RepID=A0A7U2R2F4_ASPFN|nr:methyltransferase [Aspergillus flavus]